MLKTNKFRLYPNKKQQDLLWQDSVTCNRLYNQCLEFKKESYEKYNKNFFKFDINRKITKWRRSSDRLKLVHSQVLQQVSDRLDKTYQAFFRKNKRAGFPKFRSSCYFFSLRYPQSGYKLADKYVQIKRYGRIKYKQHRDHLGKIKQICIKFDGQNWYISIAYEITPNDNSPQTNSCIAIDLGLTNIITDQDGNKTPNQNHAKYYDREIGKLQSRRTKCKRNSNKYRHFSKVVRRLYGEKSRKTKDFLHKVSHDLSIKYDTVFAENLNVKNMKESVIHGLNREVSNTQFGLLLTMLGYKAKNLILVDPYNTSKKCSSCGKINKMPLRKRIMKCKCGLIMDRDQNAAKNILCLGQARLRDLSTVVVQ